MATPEIILDSDDSDGKEEQEASGVGFDVCVSCGMKIRATELECHISSEHLSYYPFCCQSCDMRFPSKRQLMHHAIEDHSIQSSALQIRCNLDESKHMKLKKMVLASCMTKLISVGNNKRKFNGISTGFMEPPAKARVARLAVCSKSQAPAVSSTSDSSDSDDSHSARPQVKSRPPTKINRVSPPNIKSRNIQVASPPPEDPVPILPPHQSMEPQPNSGQNSTSSASNLPNEVENLFVRNIVSIELPVAEEFVELLIGKAGRNIKNLRQQLECEIIVPSYNATLNRQCFVKGLEKNVNAAKKRIEKMLKNWGKKGKGNWKSAKLDRAAPQKLSECDSHRLKCGPSLWNKKSSGKMSVGLEESSDVERHNGECEKGGEDSDRHRPSPNMNITEIVVISEAQWRTLSKCSRKTLAKDIHWETSVTVDFIGVPHKGYILKGQSSDVRIAKRLLQERFHYANLTK